MSRDNSKRSKVYSLLIVKFKESKPKVLNKALNRNFRKNSGHKIGYLISLCLEDKASNFKAPYNYAIPGIRGDDITCISLRQSHHVVA